MLIIFKLYVFTFMQIKLAVVVINEQLRYIWQVVTSNRPVTVKYGYPIKSLTFIARWWSFDGALLCMWFSWEFEDTRC